MAREPGKFVIDGMLCDSCVVAEGKLFILGGGWDAIASQQYPFVQPRIGLAMVLEIPWNQTNRNHQLRIRLVAEGEGEEPIEIPIGGSRQDADGDVVRETAIEASFNAGRPPHLSSGDSQKMPLAINLEQLVIESPGLHSFEVEVDDIEINRMTFRVLGLPGMNLNIPGGR